MNEAGADETIVFGRIIHVAGPEYESANKIIIIKGEYA
jgi:hypothetical protein